MKKISNLLMMALLTVGIGLTSCDEQLDNAVVPGVTPVVDGKGEVTSITVDLSKIDEKYLDTEKTKLQLTVGDEVTLSFTILPEEMASTEVELTAADATILSIDGLKVKALKEGETKVTAKAGEKTAECTVTVKAATYLTWDDGQKKLVATEIPATYTMVENVDADVTWQAGTYVVEGNVVCSGVLTLKGEVKLILKDGSKLTVDRISYNTGGILNIYGQSDNEATMGQLVCDKDLHADGINIYGGNITVADGDFNGAVLSFAADMTIYAGILRATSASVVGILVAPNKTLTINGGTVIARSTAPYCHAGISAGSVVINGGTVEAYGSNNSEGNTDHEGQGAPGILYKTSFDYQGGSLIAICGAPGASPQKESRAIATETLGANPIYEAGSLHNTSAAAVTVKTSTNRTSWAGTQNIAVGATQPLDFKGIKID